MYSITLRIVTVWYKVTYILMRHLIEGDIFATNGFSNNATTPWLEQFTKNPHI